MTYIVNPMVFYWIGLFSNLGITLTILNVLAGFALGIALILWLSSCIVDERVNIQFKKLKVFLIVYTISLVVTCILPNESTMYKMLIASQVTVENIDLAKTGVTDLVDYIVEKVDEMQKEDDE